MSEVPDDPDSEFPRYPSDDELASSRTEHIYELAHRVLNNDVLIGELGFANRESIHDIVIAIRAGDRLHPRMGFDYLGADWKEISKDRLFEQTDERDEEVEAILENVLSRLETDGYQAARELTLTSSPFQVIYLSRSEAETRRNLDTLLSLGLGRNELSDNLCEKRGCNLVFGYDENISYFASDW